MKLAWFRFTVLAYICTRICVNASEGGSTDGVTALLEKYDLDNSTGLNASEVELYLESLRGKDVDHCANVSEIFNAVGLPLSAEAFTTESIEAILVATSPCVLNTFCGIEFEAIIGGEEYHCTAEEGGHEGHDTGHEGHEEFELLLGNGGEFVCVLEEEEEDLPSSYSGEVWGKTLGAVLIVSFVAFAMSIVLYFGLRNQSITLRYLDDFMSFAVGILLWAAIVHVLPEAIEFYGAFDWKFGLCFVTGVFLSIVLDISFSHAHDEHLHEHCEAETEDSTESGGGNAKQTTEAENNGKPLHEHKHEFVIQKKSKPLNGLAMNIIWGDALHNFSDGVLIALSFGACGSNTALGLSVTIAVLCHEIPQELADYMMLVRAGQTPLMALLYNVLSSLSAFLGAIIVLSIGVIEPKIQGLLLSVTSGVLTFIALGELLPAVSHTAEGRKLLRLGLLLLGFVIGGLLLLIPHEHCEIGHSDHGGHSDH